MNQWPESRNIDDFISFIAEIMHGRYFSKYYASHQ